MTGYIMKFHSKHKTLWQGTVSSGQNLQPTLLLHRLQISHILWSLFCIYNTMSAYSSTNKITFISLACL